MYSYWEECIECTFHCLEHKKHRNGDFQTTGAPVELYKQLDLMHSFPTNVCIKSFDILMTRSFSGTASSLVAHCSRPIYLTACLSFRWIHAQLTVAHVELIVSRSTQRCKLFRCVLTLVKSTFTTNERLKLYLWQFVWINLVGNLP